MKRGIVWLLLMGAIYLAACNSESNLPPQEREALIGELIDSLRVSRIAGTVTAEEIANTVCECLKLVKLEKLQDKEELSKQNNPDSMALDAEMRLHMACMLTQNMYGDPIQVDSAIVIARQQCSDRYAKAENFSRLMGEQLNKMFEKPK